MLTCEQTKAIENAPGADKAGPVIQAFESLEERVKATMVYELATKADLAIVKADLELKLAELGTRVAESKGEVLRWVAGMLLAQAALIATLVKLL